MIRSGTRRPKRRLFGKLLFIISFVAIGAYFIRGQQTTIISPVPEQDKEELSFSLPFFAKKKNPQELRKLVQSLVGTNWKNYSVYVQSLSSNFEMGINETVMYEAASINKIPILAALYKRAEGGVVDLNKQITVQAADIQDYGSGTIRYEKPGATYSVKTLAALMIQQSDNTAAYIISSYIVPTPDIQQLVSGWGLTQTELVDGNQTSNRDMALLLTKLLDGEIVNTALTKELSAFLKDSAYEDRLPKELPKSATVYHKTGDAIAALHDVGIVEDAKLRYYIGIFTADITNEEETKNLMAKVSRLIYDYLRR